MTQAHRVDLAHESPFELGRLRVTPAVRQVRRDDGASEIVEHRVMQVLVALARANGAIVTRDELTASCCDDRVVGDDAINRVVSRLRRLSEGLGAGSFRIETVTRIGYRLARSTDLPLDAVPPPPRRSRRALLTGVGALAVGAVAAAIGSAWMSNGGERAPEDVRSLMEQALTAIGQGTPDGNGQATGLLQQVVARRPDYADGWGALAFTYAQAFHGVGEAEAQGYARRADAAARRALELDGRNGYARAAQAVLLPRRGSWSARERGLRAALAVHPTNVAIAGQLAWLLEDVGRNHESARLLDDVAAATEPTPLLLFLHAMSLWAADRIEEADRAIERARAYYPSHYGIWFGRFYIYLFTGRAADALAFGQNASTRPGGIPQSNFDLVLRVAQAMVSRRPADIDAAIRDNIAAAHLGAGHAEAAISFAAALGRVDDAFAIADAFYFGRGFAVPTLRYSNEQRIHTRLSDRRTAVLLNPSTAAMRSDVRFGPLVDELGLERYWQGAGVPPDFRRG